MNRLPWSIAFFVVMTCIFAMKSIDESHTATRQKQSFATLTSCSDNRGQRYCNYNFSANDQEYTGDSKAPFSAFFGEVQNVYYDPNDPTTNSLKEFLEQSHRDRNWAVLFGLIGSALAVYFVFNKKAASGSL